jgi:hypothetical protein
MIAAIEIYNKPRFDYRDECVAILLLNSWELILKALLSKNNKSIFYPKKRHEQYRTLSWHHAFNKARVFFPDRLKEYILPIERNLDLLGMYRDNAVHFYNSPDFSFMIYSIVQTNVMNFKDLLLDAFGVDLGAEISWQLLPIGLKVPVDPIQYISRASSETKRGGSAVRQFLSEIAGVMKETEDKGIDTSRLLTVFTVKLESIKKIEAADFVVGVGKTGSLSGPLTIIKRTDPNVSHPLRQKDVVKEIADLHGRSFTSFVFQAIAARYNIKDNTQLCWKASEGCLIRYSMDIVAWIRRLSAEDVEDAIRKYKNYRKEKCQSRKINIMRRAK